jgi:hypothetical protein
MNEKSIEIKESDGQLSQNYFEMNETGREKLKEVSGKILDIWKTVNEDLPKHLES